MKDNSNDTFWQDVESKHNGKITFKSYAKLLHYQHNKTELHGLIYIINNTIYFEDFEPENNVFGVPIRTNKTYVKSEFQFMISDFKICMTSKKMFEHCMNTRFKLEALKKTRPGFFDNPLCIIYNDYDYYIFDISAYKQLQKLLQSMNKL